MPKTDAERAREIVLGVPRCSTQASVRRIVDALAAVRAEAGLEGAAIKASALEQERKVSYDAGYRDGFRDGELSKARGLGND